MEEIRLEAYTHDELVQITRSMVEGLSYEEAIARLVPESTLAYATLIHSMLCNKRHNKEEGSCEYYNPGDNSSKELWHKRAETTLRNIPVDVCYDVASALKAIMAETLKVEKAGGEPALSLLLAFILEMFSDTKPMEL